jgi:hypothetical protein
MTDKTEGGGRRGGVPWRLVGWAGAGLVLLAPMAGNAPWSLSDYVFAAVLLGAAGLALELAARSGSLAYRAGVAVAVAAGVLLIWVNGAVGLLGDEDNAANLMFFGVLAVAVVGAVLARLRAAGLARAMFAAAAAQVAAGAVALAGGLGSAGNAGLYEAALSTGVFTPLWLAAGWLFRKAARNAEQVTAMTV